MRRLIVILLLFAVSSIQAQDDSASDGWEIVERCISEPTAPPDDWSYEGIIFLRSDRAIHGMTAHIPTPYIIAYNDPNGIFGLSGALSPTGEWFAVPEGTGGRDGSFVYRYDITRIRTYSTDGRRNIHTLELDKIVKLGSNFYINSVDTPMWINETEFLYPQQGATVDNVDLYQYNPFTREVSNSDEIYQPQPLYLTNRIPSDDERLAIVNRTFVNHGLHRDSPDNTLFSFLTNSTLYIGNPITQTFTDQCINATGMVFSSSGEIIISTGEEILYIQNEHTYRLAYHDGIVFDWRFPSED